MPRRCSHPFLLFPCRWLHWTSVMRRMGWLGLLGMGLSVGMVRAEERQVYQVPAGEVTEVLAALTGESGLELLYQVEDLRGTMSLGVRGVMKAEEALGKVLRGTGLEAVKDARSGAFVIRPVDARAGRVTAAEPPRGFAAGRPATATFVPGTDVFELSPFEVRSGGDLGYRATQTISATRMAVAAGELPLAVTAFTREFIEDQHPYDLYEVVKWAPGVHQDNVSPQGWVRFNLRGFTRAAVQRNGFDAYRFIDTSNIERVEVVRGPASLLYGQINPGGVINYLTKRPEMRRQASLDLSVGSDHYARAVLDVTGPLFPESHQLAGRLVLMTEDIPRFQELSSGRKNLIAPSVTWNLVDRVSLTLSYEHFERLDDLPTSGVVLRFEDRIPTVPYEPLPEDFSYAGEGDFQDFISDAISAELTWKLADNVSLQATYLDSYWDMEWRASGQGGTGLLNQAAIDAFYPPEVGLTPADAMYRRNRWEHQWGGERSGQVDLVSEFMVGSVDLRLVLGAKRAFSNRYRGQQRNNPNRTDSPYYLAPWDLRDSSTWNRAVPFGVEVLETVADTESGGSGSSLHAVGMATFNQGRSRILGGISRHQLHNAPATNRLTGAVTARSERAANVPQVGVTHELVPGITAFASASKSFLANPSLLLVDNVPTKPAKASIGSGAEAGIKLDLGDGRFSGTFSVYHIRANPTDVVRVNTGNGPDGTTLFSDLQGGSQRSHGAEVDLMFTLRDDWQLMLSASWCDAIYVEHPSKPNFNGTSLVATPESTFNLWSKYAPRTGPLAGWMVAGGLSYVGSFTHVALNPRQRMPAYATVDLTVGRRWQVFGQALTAELAVKNLTNERYYASSSSWSFPRQWILSLRTEF